MNTNWSKILLFSLLFGALGFILGRMCGHAHGCGHHEGCGPREEACMQGGHCEGGMHGGMMHGEKEACCAMGDRCEQDIQGMVKGLRASGYQGDTTVHMGCCEVKVGIHGDRTMVEVEKRDSMHVEMKEGAGH